MRSRKRFQVGVLSATAAGLFAASAVCAQAIDASRANIPDQGAGLRANFSEQGTGLRVDRSMFAAPHAESPSVVLPGSLPTTVESYQMDLFGGSAILLETARITSDGRYVRPRLTIGSESTELKSWMKSAGFQAERCMLPMFRARLRRDEATGDIGSTFWVSARCKFY